MIRIICQREAENPVAPQSTTPPNNPVRMKKKIDEKTDAMDAEMNFFTLPKRLGATPYTPNHQAAPAQTRL
jgi:hypothetical protein